MEREEYTMDKIRIDELEGVAGGGLEGTVWEDGVERPLDGSPLDGSPSPQDLLDVSIRDVTSNPHAKIKRGPGIG